RLLERAARSAAAAPAGADWRSDGRQCRRAPGGGGSGRRCGRRPRRARSRGARRLCAHRRKGAPPDERTSSRAAEGAGERAREPAGAIEMRREKTVTFGELMLRLSAPGHERLLQSPTLNATFGGAEANVAVSLAHFGLDSHFVTRLPANAV